LTVPLGTSPFYAPKPLAVMYGKPFCFPRKLTTNTVTTMTSIAAITI